MAWPRRIYAATTALGVFYTDDFVDPTTQPTWTAVNTGLAATDCREFWLDPFAPADRQYVLLSASRTLYRRDGGGNWASILTPAQADVITSQSPGTLSSFYPDPTIPGRLWVLYGPPAVFAGPEIWAFVSDDYGDSWDAEIYDGPGGTPHGVSFIRAIGDNVWLSTALGAGASQCIGYSSDGGANWDLVADIEPWVTLNPLLSTLIYTSVGPGLTSVSNAGATSLLQAARDLERLDNMWFNPGDADHQRLLDTGRLYVTNDAWTNINAPDAITPAPYSIAPWAGADTDQMLVGITIGVGQPHAVGALYGEADTTATGIAGTNCGSAPFTDSIPNTCGGLCSMGLQAIEGVGTVHTYSVAMPGYAGTERGEPVPGDRASWETGATHADDIEDASFDYHNNPADPPMLVSDYDSDDDGIVDAAETAPWAGITDKPTEFTPEDHDHSGDAGDGGTFDAANLTSGASTDGQVLTSDGAGGAAWEDPAGGALALDGLTDVNAPAPDDGDVLTWDDGAGEWVADAPPAGGGDMTKAVYDADDDGSVDKADAIDGVAAAGNSKYYGTNGAGAAGFYDLPAGGVVDAANVTYTPTTPADWDGGADPGNADGAFDQLAERVKDLEGGGGGGTDVLMVQVFT